MSRTYIVRTSTDKATLRIIGPGGLWALLAGLAPRDPGSSSARRRTYRDHIHVAPHETPACRHSRP
jgi:hypothetical protein